MEKFLKTVAICACAAILVAIALVSYLPKEINFDNRNSDIDITKHIKALKYLCL